MKLRYILFILSVALFCKLGAQPVTRTDHHGDKDEVTTGTMTIRKPDYICISTNGGKESLIMEGTKFTMGMGGRQYVTDSRKNNQFAAFHDVLKAVINGQPVPAGKEVTVVTKNGQKIITITPPKKWLQMFSSYVLVTDADGSVIRRLRMNGKRGGRYINYDVQ